MNNSWEIIGFGWMGIDVLESNLTEEDAKARMVQIKKSKEYSRYDTIMMKDRTKSDVKKNN